MRKNVLLLIFFLVGCSTSQISAADNYGNNQTVANTALEWLATNTWSPSTRTYYLRGHINPYISTTEHPIYYWDYWCAGFVGQVAQTANGRPDTIFVKSAPSLDVPPSVKPYSPSRDTPDKIGAKVAFNMMTQAGRIHTDFSRMPIGAAVFWTGGLPYGHVAIFSGHLDQSGSPMIVTTGWPARPGTRLRSLADLNLDLGPPAGWAAL